MANILLIDDDATHVSELHVALKKELEGTGITIEVWMPDASSRPDTKFAELVSKDTFFVVTDYDLTGNGKTGLFGSAIVDWCKQRFIPVGDYSRGQAFHPLPKETDQYEIRVPPNPIEAATYVRQLYEGFAFLRRAVNDRWEELAGKRSPAAILAEILNRPLEQSRFALYSTKLGISNAAITDRISAVDSRETAVQEMKQFFPYVLGHLLLNVILRFPGPIMHSEALAAFLAIHPSELPSIENTFQDARYHGPFSDIQKFYWSSAVDQLLSSVREDSTEDEQGETVGELNRRTLQNLYKGREFRLHECTRCQGIQGGLFCPFTRRAVCQRPTCSVPSNAWIPQGARLCRIEKDFYDEWAPLLGF